MAETRQLHLNAFIHDVGHHEAAWRGHRTFTGTPEQLADNLELWFTAGAADGFNIMPPAYPADLETFIDQVVPILRKRGLFRERYEAATLRGNYGLERPANRFAGAVPA